MVGGTSLNLDSCLSMDGFVQDVKRYMLRRFPDATV